MCIHNSLRGSMREQDIFRWGRQGGVCIWGRAGALVSWLSSLEGTDTQLTLLQYLSPSVSLCFPLNNLSHIIYLYLSISFTLTHTDMQLSPLSTQTHTYAHALGVVRSWGWRSEQAGICTEGNLIGIPCAKHMRSPWLTDPACQPALPPSRHCHQIKTCISEKSTAGLKRFSYSGSCILGTTRSILCAL